MVFRNSVTTGSYRHRVICAIPERIYCPSAETQGERGGRIPFAVIEVDQESGRNGRTWRLVARVNPQGIRDLFRHV